MSSNKSFRVNFLGGFNKKDVSNYVEKIYREFEIKLKEKDEEMNMLKNQLRDLRMKYEELQRNADKVSDDRVKIADVLIKAQEKAESILEEARKNALDEKNRIEALVVKEKEKFERARSDLNDLKSGIQRRIREYELQLDDILGEETIEDIIVNNSEILGKL